eukprot:TRINITY_DN122469_c0_g1_i1.p2 TRINITY_DN122469_c0_g1~~TRINITY_DN122469_c0_g1_i1.p2  ORF type:complete len:275 (+),score=-6.15 TRINITY_DN122469_c0_g1_i1:698-1522(+)
MEKKEKDIYLPPKKPVVIDIPCFKFFVIDSKGNLNSVFFGECIEALYAVSYAIRMSYKKGSSQKDFLNIRWLAKDEMSSEPIEWNYPPPRKGFKGTIDKFVGPGATKVELLLQTVVPIVATVVALLYVANSDLNWSWFQYLICGVLAIDISGGVVTNSTSSAKRWYHRDGQTFWNFFGFTSLHLLHIIVVSWVFLGWDYSWILFSGGYLIVSSIIILSVKTYIQRPVAMIAFSLSLVLSLYVLESPQGLEWFLPLLYLKLLVCHLLREEPYQAR